MAALSEKIWRDLGGGAEVGPWQILPATSSTRVFLICMASVTWQAISDWSIACHITDAHLILRFLNLRCMASYDVVSNICRVIHHILNPRLSRYGDQGESLVPPYTRGSVPLSISPSFVKLYGFL